MKLKLFTLLFTLMLAGLAWAAENAPQNQEQQAEQQTETDPEAPADAEAIPGDPSLATDDTDAEALEEGLEDEESPGRFIPTEQISQDLGVSFPVDI